MPRDELYFQDIVKSINDVERFIKRVDESKFLADEILQNAVLLKLIVIGEAAARISEETRKKYPSIDWNSIIGFRNTQFTLIFLSNGTLFGKPPQMI